MFHLVFSQEPNQVACDTQAQQSHRLDGTLGAFSVKVDVPASSRLDSHHLPSQFWASQSQSHSMTFNVHPIIPAFTMFHKNPKSYQLVQDGLSIHSREACPTGRCPHGSTPTARGRLEFPSTAGGMYAENGVHLLTTLHRCAWINPKKNRLNMLKLIPFLTMFILSERSCPKWYCLLYCFPTSMKKKATTRASMKAPASDCQDWDIQVYADCRMKHQRLWILGCGSISHGMPCYLAFPIMLKELATIS